MQENIELSVYHRDAKTISIYNQQKGEEHVYNAATKKETLTAVMDYIENLNEKYTVISISFYHLNLKE